jgi:simple sugar transport system permease protein
MANVWSPNSELPAASFFDPSGKVGSVFNSNNLWISVVVVLLMAVFMYVYLNYSKHGYEISVVGESENTAKYIGVNVKKVIIRTMIISGLVCGLAGFITAAFNLGVSASDAKGYGFTAIMVAWLAKFNPLVMILSAFLFIFVSRGGQELTVIGFPKEYSEILVGILLFFIIGCEFFINYRIVPGNLIKKMFGKSAPASADEVTESTTVTTEEKEEN